MNNILTMLEFITEYNKRNDSEYSRYDVSPIAIEFAKYCVENLREELREKLSDYADEYTHIYQIIDKAYPLDLIK